MDVRRVVPDAGQLGRRAVEDDPLAHEHEPSTKRSTAPNSCET